MSSIYVTLSLCDVEVTVGCACTLIRIDTKQLLAVTSCSDALSMATDATAPPFIGWERTDGHCLTTPWHRLTFWCFDASKVLMRDDISASWGRSTDAGRLRQNSPCLVLVYLFYPSNDRQTERIIVVLCNISGIHVHVVKLLYELCAAVGNGLLDEILKTM